MDILKKYAHLLVHYCLEIKKGEKLYITTTTLAEPLLREVYREAIRAGAMVDYQMTFREQHKIFIAEANDQQLDYVNPAYQEMMQTYDAYLVIRAPFNVREDQSNAAEKTSRRQAALNVVNQIYSERIADRSLKRCLCQYPTQAAAQEAGMSLEEYENFVYEACHLFANNPSEEWIKVRTQQQSIVDYLNQCDLIRYKNKKSDISFSVKDRIWINSDGRSNMPSGEVFTGPIENSVEGYIYFNFPIVFMGHEIEGVTLYVEKGQVMSWDAEKGKDFLNDIFKIEGARYFGEVAIGTNYNIRKTTKNILFDEKIGGSVHMAIGQSYKQTGGTNHSPIHWDMITDMKDGGEIWADGKLIYMNGAFLF
ncbi:MAG: aminopeptidase [Saprospiraceae bacterium]|nr:aminopeptidase [Saprospiraceae bacterium]MBK8668501.1 aminopeptidase [Saprospiraceae bacterium]